MTTSAIEIARALHERPSMCLRQHLQDVITVGILETEFREVSLPRMASLIALAGVPLRLTKEPE